MHSRVDAWHPKMFKCVPVWLFRKEPFSFRKGQNCPFFCHRATSQLNKPVLTRINGNLVSNPWILTQVAKALLLADILCCQRIFQIFVCSTSWTLLPSTCYGQHLLSNPLHSTAIPRSGNCHADFSSVQNATNYLTPTSYGVVLRIIPKTYLSKFGKWLGRKKVSH